jgi:transcriptional regulator with XRE-family HTH domain
VALRAERKRRGLSQRAAAREIGVSQPAVVAWENGGDVSPLNDERVRVFLRLTVAQYNELLLADREARREIVLDRGRETDQAVDRWIEDHADDGDPPPAGQNDPPRT